MIFVMTNSAKVIVAFGLIHICPFADAIVYRFIDRIREAEKVGINHTPHICTIPLNPPCHDKRVIVRLIHAL